MEDLLRTILDGYQLPNEGHHGPRHWIRVDGISMGAVGTLTLPKLMADHTVTALFH